MAFKKVNPKSDGQKYFQRILDDKSYDKIVVLAPSGCGKSLFIAQRVAQDYLAGNLEKIILIRSLEPLREENQVGWLKGSIDDKMSPWLAPTLQHLRKFLPVEKLIADKVIEFVPLEMIRGLSFENCAVVATEIQNISTFGLKSLLTRMGKHSRLYCDGDMDQCDRDISQADMLYDICDALHASIKSFALVEMGTGDIFRDKNIEKILKVFKEFEH